MVFSSPLFLACFLPALLGLYFLCPAKGRNAVLLGGSLFFYAWGEPRAVFLMLALILVNHAAGRGIAAALAAPGGGRRRRANALLALGVAADLGALALFKYASFLSANLRALGLPVPDPGIALPIGVSFYVFQCVSYLADVRRGDVPAERSLPAFALYVSLFPQLIAGPIVRYRTVRAEMRDRTARADAVAEGLRRFGRGLAKKVLLADVLARAVDAAFLTGATAAAADPARVPCAVAWAGALCYALQIYYDFSGYSDMAIGLGRVFNFHFLENFDHPYGATSVREFWRRWHLSLSTWFRDYLYIPLGGSRRGAARTYLNLVIVFALCGLWHGASWCFVVWGLWHGTGLVAERVLLRKRPPHPPSGPANPGTCEPANLQTCEPANLQTCKPANLQTCKPANLRTCKPANLRTCKPANLFGNLYVWLFALVGWVPFKAGMDGRGLAWAGRYLRAMFSPLSAPPLRSFWPAMEAYSHLGLLALLCGLLLCYPKPAARLAPRGDGAWAHAASLALFLAAYLFAMTGSYSPFIYFRF